jgi:hypothetical protein
MQQEKVVKIGGACAFIGDSVLGPRQLVDVEGMHYIVFDYLAEMTLSSFAMAKEKDPKQGYASEFVQVVLREILPRCAERGIKLVANAGGLNPRACADAINALQREYGSSMKVAFVEGDDCLTMMPDLCRKGVLDFYTQTPMPEQVASANAYLGALPIARALAMGADIVITGRIVDSATTLGILMHEFGWSSEDFHLLSAGSLAGHILECGAQATGGTHTDWDKVPNWENIGYPVVEFRANGDFIVTKPPGTGGLVGVATVSEQTLYEVGDPAFYTLPDVVCDFSAVTITARGDDRVFVTGARGRPPTDTYKVSATYQDGYRCVAQISVLGIDAVKKARRMGEVLIARVRSFLDEKGYGDFEKIAATVIGAEDPYGPHATKHVLREAVTRVAAVHQRSEALDILSRESRCAGVAWAPGATSGSAMTLNSRPAVEPRYRLFSCLVPKKRFPPPKVFLGELSCEVVIPSGSAEALPPVRSSTSPNAERLAADWLTVPLIAVAYARSGDKGDHSNVAVFAREPRFLPYIEQAITEDSLKAYLGHLVKGEVRKYNAQGLCAINFMLHHALDGGGPTSLRADPLGKAMAQMVLEMPVQLPAEVAPEIRTAR